MRKKLLPLWLDSVWEMLDAPVSGGAVKAANGEMTVMASGSDMAFERLAPVLEAVAGKVYRIGAEPGLGSTVKIIHQLLAGVHIAAGAEAMALAARAGIPLDVMIYVVTNAAGNSWMFENRMRHVVDGDYTPHSAVDIFVKDLSGRRYRQSPALPAAVGLNSIEYVHQRQ
ncbi:NAD-binding protein [Escherichia coli]